MAYTMTKQSRFFFLILNLLCSITIVSCRTCPSKPSEVKTLAGLSQTELPCMYSGFISVDETSNSQLYYWLILSDDWMNSPLVIWLNGGPGASSLFGLFTEMGPLRLKTSGGIYVENEKTWTNRTSVLYLDQPIGTGYSFTDNYYKIPQTEEAVTIHFYRFLQKFFILHNELVDKRLYIIGESYAGKYIPNMARFILEENDKISKGTSHNQKLNLKKIAIGNGLFDAKYQRAARKDLAKGLGILSEFDDEPQYDALVKNCEFSVSLNNTDSLERCNEIMDFVMDLAGDVFEFDIRKSRGSDNELLKALNTFLNREDVVSDLHVKNSTIKSQNNYWVIKNETVSSALRNEINLISSIPVLAKILDNFDLPILIYAGQFDLVDGPQGIERALQSMDFKNKEAWKRAPRELWKIPTPAGDQIIAGYIKQSNNLIFITMRNAGHFAPRDRPGSALNILDHIFSDEKTWKCPDNKCSLVSRKCQAMKNCNGNGLCSELTGGKCICSNDFFGPDCSIKPEMLLSNKVVKMSPRDTKMYNLSHYDTDVLLEIDSDDHNILISLVHKDQNEFIFNIKEHVITYRLVNHKLVLFIEKERFNDYHIVITNLEFIDEITLQIYVNTYSNKIINFIF
jgi:carboxypeptidase C (cathepsin A)